MQLKIQHLKLSNSAKTENRLIVCFKGGSPTFYLKISKSVTRLLILQVNLF